MSISKVLCPIDLSDLSILGLKQAAEIAKEHQAELTVMHVSSNFFHADKDSEDYTRLLDTFLDEVQELKKVVDDLNDIQSRAYHCLGNPANEIVDYAKKQECDLVVFGSHGKSGLKKMILGSVADKVIRSAETNLLVVRESPEKASYSFRCYGTQPVIIPFDFSDACFAALEFADKLGIAAGRLHIVNVSEPPQPFSDGGESKQKLESEMISENRARFYTAPLAGKFKDAEFRTLFDFDVAGRIANYANEILASLIVMPTNQKNFLTRFFLGSVANTVTKVAPCPTLIVKQSLTRAN